MTRRAEPGPGRLRRIGMRGYATRWTAGLGIAGAALLAGCSAATTGGGGAANGPAAAPARAATGGNGAPAAGGGGIAASNAGSVASRAGSTASPAGSTTRLAATSQDVVFTSGMTIKVSNAGQAAARAAQIAQSAGGYVSQENAALRPVPWGGGTVVIQLKIPVAAYAATLTVLSKLGTTGSEQQQARVVTQQVADIASQVTSDQAAIAQLRALLRQAGSVSQLLSIQSQIASQESALEAMQAQQRALDNQTSYGTVTLHLTGPVKAAVRVQHHRVVRHHAGGFVPGISHGWRALVVACSWLLQVLGAVLPIGAVLALLAYLVLRARRTRWWPHRRPAPPPDPNPGNA